MRSRPTLVMLPGTLCDARIFQHQRRTLRDVADIRALDYRDWTEPEPGLTAYWTICPSAFRWLDFLWEVCGRWNCCVELQIGCNA